MKVIKTIKDMQALVQQLRRDGQSIGFVPTMGFLHEGHCSLMQRARKENDVVVLSIFVNPTQFGPNEDFDTYPRDFERDEQIALKEGVDYLFYPSVEEMYKENPSVSISVINRVDVLCGAKRAGHFDGVATILTKLFHIVSPHRAYFGKKDAQQVAVVHGLIKDFNFPVELVAIDTVREEDGLAKSSRNVYLTEAERTQAPVLYKSLRQAVEKINQGETNPDRLKEIISANIQAYTSAEIDYVEVYSYPELQPVTTVTGQVILAVAVQFSKARLIDNLIIEV
ncbi:pantoate--beta-alanine ligase [Priestia megaterium]|nr:pantoate--beta-alanine ligase [Priestia megaterium]